MRDIVYALGTIHKLRLSFKDQMGTPGFAKAVAQLPTKIKKAQRDERVTRKVLRKDIINFMEEKEKLEGAS